MGYEVEVYLAGPLSLWQRAPHPREIIARRSARWLWHAHSKATFVLKAADSGRCGYVIRKDGEIVHHQQARDQECNPLESEAMHFDIDENIAAGARSPAVARAVTKALRR